MLKKQLIQQQYEISGERKTSSITPNILDADDNFLAEPGFNQEDEEDEAEIDALIK